MTTGAAGAEGRVAGALGMIALAALLGCSEPPTGVLLSVHVEATVAATQLRVTGTHLASGGDRALFELTDPEPAGGVRTDWSLAVELGGDLGGERLSLAIAALAGGAPASTAAVVVVLSAGDVIEVEADLACPPGGACAAPVCGDGAAEGDEACDDGNTAAGDGCRADCTIEACGDGVVDDAAGEACDDGNLDPSDACVACAFARCGDGALRFGEEECDDGNTLAGDGCSPACATEACGDGDLDPGEGCDDGNLVSGDGCSRACRVEACGDGITQLDLGADRLVLSWLAVSPTCGAAGGDLELWVNGALAARAPLAGPACPDPCAPGPGELTVDDPVALALLQHGANELALVFPFSDGRALAWAVLEVIGVADQEVVLFDAGGGGDALSRAADACVAGADAVGPAPAVAAFVATEERCDDGNTDAGDGCSPLCQPEVCGDGWLDPGEECDDGNLVAADGCTSGCALE